MRFSPHRTVPSNPLEEIAPGYDSLSEDSQDEDYYPTSSPFNSSPLKSTVNNTPSKSPLSYKKSKWRRIHKSFHFSPLSNSPINRSELTRSKLFDETGVKTDDSEEDLDYYDDSDTKNSIEEELSSLLNDLDFKERYLLARQNTKRRSTLRLYNGLNSSSRPSSIHSRPSSVIINEDQDLNKDLEKLKLREIEKNVINGLEARLSKRSKDINLRLNEIEQQRIKEEEERKKIEAEKKRLEEERKLKEEQERKRKEAEAKKLKEEQEQRAKQEKEAKEKAEKLKAEQEQKEKEAKVKLALEEKEREAKKGKGLTDFKQIEKEFLNYKNRIKTIKKDIVEAVRQDQATKKAVSTHKRKINPKFGQLTNSLTQLSKITTDLKTLINETKPSPLAFQWILNFVSKAIVSQSETEVRAKPSSSVPLAKLTLNLLCEFPELKEFLMTRFVKKCPFIIGYSCDISTEEGRLRMGWKRNSDSKWEDEISYDERMGGMMTLYSVITRLKLDDAYYSNLSHPLPISNSWVLTSRILNTQFELWTNTHFIVLSSWWESCAFEFLQSYGKQGSKILELMWRDFADFALNSNRKFSGANTLKAIGEDWANSGKLKQFGEMER